MIMRPCLKLCGFSLETPENPNTVRIGDYCLSIKKLKKERKSLYVAEYPVDRSGLDFLVSERFQINICMYD